MTANVWTQNSGYNLGTAQERTRVNILLPVSNDTGVTYSVISGQLPGGLRLSGHSIIGTPYEVARPTTYTVCIRASKDNSISDRTFTITVEGADEPTFITPAGDLPIGTNNQYFVLDSTYVNFQISAIDFDTAAGQKLSYFIADNDGQLPPGLVLTSEGQLVGFVQPVLSIKPSDGNGFYDDGTYDNVAFDFGERSTNGYDSYYFDNVFYDFNVTSQPPKKLNRNYEFIVSVTDGDTVSKRKFKIFVVGTDYFKADNNILTDGTGLFTADATYMRAPVWLTPGNLGVYRANNYITLVLDTYDTENVIYVSELVNANVYATTKQLLTTDNVAGSTQLTIYNTTAVPSVGNYLTFTGLIEGATSDLYQVLQVASTADGYRLTLDAALTLNIPDKIGFLIGTKSILPPGMEVDLNNAEVFGRVPYQPAVTTSYNFTITAKRFSDKGEIAQSSRMFTIQIIGEIDSTITWNTDSDLGSVNANFISTLSINASSTVTDAVVIYKKISGKLPPGLSLTTDGEIIGKVKQYGDAVVYRSVWRENRPYPLNSIVLHNGTTYKRTVEYTTPELTFITGKWELYNFSYAYRGIWLPLTRYSVNDVVQYDSRFYKRILPYEILLPETSFIADNWEEFYQGLTTFSDISTSTTYTNQSIDLGTTTVDRVFAFTVDAHDQYNFSAVSRTFYITVKTPNQKTFSNIKVKPYLKLDQRSMWSEFINDSTIFTSESIYRPNDDNFGIQTSLSMLIYAGIETTEAAAYVGAIGLNHKKKQFQFGDVKKARAVLPGTTDEIYEVVYVEMIDPVSVKHRPSVLKKLSKQPQSITVDNSNVLWQKGFLDSDPLKQEQIDILEYPAPYSDRPEPQITIDSTGYFASNPNSTTYFPSCVSIWRDRIKTLIGDTERNYLPLWMRSIQPGSKQELDFVLCVPLCYCRVGTADDIILNIKFSDFDFKLLDYTVDRYIIDAVQGSTEDKYLVFKNDRITV